MYKPVYKLAVLLIPLCLWTPVYATEEAPTPMDLGYAALEQAREQLRWRLDMLKRKSWGVALPATDAKQVVRDLGQGYHMLRHPPLRAAFHSLEEIEAEQAEIDAMNRRLDRVEALFEAAD